jgi:hypothetical protein
MTDKMYKYSQEFMRNKNFASDILNREGVVFQSKGGDTQLSIGARFTIIGKENSGLFKVRPYGSKNKTNYVAVTDAVLLPKLREEFVQAREIEEEVIAEIDRKLNFLAERETEEFDTMDFNAWNIMKSLKDSTTDEDILKTITKALISVSEIKED